MSISAIRLALGSIVLAAACTPPRTALPPVISPPRTGDTAIVGGGESVFTLLPGRFEYSLTQSTKVDPVPTSGMASGKVLTTGRLVIDVAESDDSTFMVSASIDSLQTTTEGPIPSRMVGHSTSLGLVLRAFMRPAGGTVQNMLADSLCAYGQLVSLARDVLLPQLPLQVTALTPSTGVDSTRIIACRAGSRVEMLVTREITNPKREPVHLTLQGVAQLNGAGVLGRDSVVISGSITTRGMASLTAGSRLPSTVQTESEGLITVRVGDSTAVFHQSSSQRLDQRAAVQPTTHPPN